MIGLAIRFPAGRYHATPWGAHVNEATVEWPPSPWRLMRALVSAWHRTASELSASEIEALLGALADPPRYRMPEVAPAHTRHYMPDRDHRRDVRPSQNLVFDSFLRLDPGRALTVSWDVELPPLQLALLRRLAAGVTYLGRSESWCDVEVVDDAGEGAEMLPVAGSEAVPDSEIVRLLAPSRPVALPALDVTTAELQGGRMRRRDPPGTRWLRYARPLGWAAPHRRRRRRPSGVVAQAVLWALDASPLPLLTQVEDLVEAVRRAIPLRQTEGTGRLHVLAYPSDLVRRPARPDRVALWAEVGLTARELDIVCALGPFSAPGLGADQLVPLLLGTGRPEDLGGPLFGPAGTWSSVTPLVPLRRVQLGRRDEPLSPAQLVAESVAARSLPGVRVLGPATGPAGWLEFRRGFAIGARLEFPAAVAGPVLAAHQRPGFGLFLSEEA